MSDVTLTAEWHESEAAKCDLAVRDFAGIDDVAAFAHARMARTYRLAARALRAREHAESVAVDDRWHEMARGAMFKILAILDGRA